MTEKKNSGNREEVPLERIVLSNMYSLEALIDVLVEKGLVTREEVLKRMEKVVEEPKPVFWGGHPSVWKKLIRVKVAVTNPQAR